MELSKWKKEEQQRHRYSPTTVERILKDKLSLAWSSVFPSALLLILLYQSSQTPQIVIFVSAIAAR